MSTLRLVRIAEPMIDSSSVDAKYQPQEMKMSPHETHFVIGRNNAQNRPDFCLESSLNRRMISRKHATLERTPQGFKIFDHSLNGTYVNYSRLMSVGGTVLKPGNIVTFGHLNGANIRPGETVLEYATDLKYRVEIVETPEPTTRHHGSLASNMATSPTSRKRPREESTTHHKTSSSSSATGKKARDSGASSLKKKSIGGGTSGKKGSKGSNKAAALMSEEPAAGYGMGAEEYHTENEQCNAVPCKKPQGTNIDWIQCDGCEGWYHQICVGVSDVDDNETYMCPYCDS